MLTAGVDLGKYLNHWIVVAWSNGGNGHVVHYGQMEVASDGVGVEQALAIALRELGELMNPGWPQGSLEGQRLLPMKVFVDARYMTNVVYDFCCSAGDRYLACVGRGVAQQRDQWHQRVTQTKSVVRSIGEGWHLKWLPENHTHLVEIDADHWKSWWHQRLATEMGQPGAMTLFQAQSSQHLALARHLTGEVKTEEFIAGKGVQTRWERQRR